MHMICSWFLMFHLTFYNISHRIKLLTIFLKPQNDMKNISLIRNKQRMRNKLRSCGFIFDQICLAFNKVASTFSLSVFIFLPTIMILSVTSLFKCYSYGYRLRLTYDASLNAWYFIQNVTMITVILKAAESPSKEVYHR